jgi:hypothetical protein
MAALPAMGTYRFEVRPICWKSGMSHSRTSPKNCRRMSAARGKGDGGDIGSGSFMEGWSPLDAQGCESSGNR